MDDDLFADPQLYEYLLLIDRDLCQRARRVRCTRCAARLDSATYPRKPRGLPPGLGEIHRRRLSLCCDACRKRVTPPSVRFLGRRVYTAVVLVLACVQPLTAPRLRELKDLLGVDRRTLYRWRRWWRASLVRSPWWRLACGRFRRPLDASCLPAALLERFDGVGPAHRLVQALTFLAPLSVPAGHAG